MTEPKTLTTNGESNSNNYQSTGDKMNIGKLSDAAKVTTINEICDGLKEFIKNNPEQAEAVLPPLAEMLDNLSEDDFFGTEGWVHAFGIE